MAFFRTSQLVIAAGLTFASSLQCAPPDLGTVCIAPNSKNLPKLFTPGQNYNPATLAVQIDKGQWYPWPHEQSLKLPELDLSPRHLVVLRSDGKPLQSFWFRFFDYCSNDLCMMFDGYQGVQL